MRHSSILVALAALLAAGCGDREHPRLIRPLDLRPAPVVAKAPAGGELVRARAGAARSADRRPDPSRPRSRAVGRPHDGRLSYGVQLPATGPDWLTWDPIEHVAPNREWRRWGTDRLVATVQRVLADYRAANPGVPRVLVGDLSRPRGGVFDSRYGGLGHASHQNGLDVDIYYPRSDRRERQAFRVSQVDRRLAQDLVDRFVAAGARFVFVGFDVRPRGPRGVVQSIPHHEDHLHVRIR